MGKAYNELKQGEPAIERLLDLTRVNSKVHLRLITLWIDIFILLFSYFYICDYYFSYYLLCCGKKINVSFNIGDRENRCH